MTATIPFIRKLDFEYGVPKQISPKITRIIANNPTPFTYFGTGTLIVGNNDVMVIDAGPKDEAHFKALKSALKGKNITHILVTHAHGDHYPLSSALKKWCGAEIYGANQRMNEDIEDVPKLMQGFIPDIHLKDGDIIENSEVKLRAIFTPGHSANHFCFAFDEENSLFSGDHIMGWSSTVVLPPDGNMHQYIENLKRIYGMNFDTIYPTHGDKIINPKNFIKALIEHRLDREHQIIEALKWKENNISHLVRIIYADIAEHLIVAATQNLYAHLIRLEEIGIVETIKGNGIDATYRLT